MTKLVVPSRAQRSRYCSNACKYRYRQQPARTHGAARLPTRREYRVWHHIVSRCTDPANANYKNYGGRGISIHPAWLADPRSFIDWLDQNLGPRPDGMTLDRIDVDGDYEPGNLRWADAFTQRTNTRVARSPLVGASYIQRTKKWRAQITRNYKNHYLGDFATPEEAHNAYIQARTGMDS